MLVCLFEIKTFENWSDLDRYQWYDERLIKLDSRNEIKNEK